MQCRGKTKEQAVMSVKIDATLAKELLGWEQSEDIVDDHYITNEEGKKVQCVNNDHNRPSSETCARVLSQDILDSHWRGYEEAIAIGKFGKSGQRSK
jgi:hypothetical protein